VLEYPQHNYCGDREEKRGERTKERKKQNKQTNKHKTKRKRGEEVRFDERKTPKESKVKIFERASTSTAVAKERERERTQETERQNSQVTRKLREERFGVFFFFLFLFFSRLMTTH